MSVMLAPDPGNFPRTASNENRLPTAMAAGRGPPPRAPPSNGSVRASMPGGGNRRLASFREVGAAVCRSNSGGGITLSESIRNSGAVLEEHEAKIRTLQREMEGLSNELQGKDRELATLNTTMNERVDKKQKEIEQLRDNARASEMAIRGLEDEIRLLRKQNNEIDRASRHAQGRNTNQPAQSSCDEEMQSKLTAAEQQVRQLKSQVSQGEEDARSLRQKLAALQAQLDTQKSSQKGADREDKSAQSQITALEKGAAEREKEMKQLRAEIASLKAAMSKAEDAAAKAKKESEGSKRASGGSDDEVKELKAKLLVAEEKLAAMSSDLQKASKDLEAAQKCADEAKRACEAARARVSELEAEAKLVRDSLTSAQGEVAQLRKELSRVQSEVEGLKLRGNKLEDDLSCRNARVVELEGKVADLQALLDARSASDKSANLEVELEALRVRCQAAEDASHTHKMAATEAQALASISKKKAETVGAQLSDAEDALAGLRQRVAELEKADKEALARLCRIRELEAEVHTHKQHAVAVESERDSAQSSCRIFEKQLAALQDAASAEKSKLEKELKCGKEREDALAEEVACLRRKASSPADIPADAQKQLSTLGSEVDKLQKQQALQAQVHKLQMLLRMAEITKLEEHIKCTRRSDSVKEEKMGLLTYNLASAESQIAQDNLEAGQKRQAAEEAQAKRKAVREERMGVLNKKQKQEEDKMRTNEESFTTQSKRLKEKLRELESQLKALA